jgi:hypothetical protein
MTVPRTLARLLRRLADFFSVSRRTRRNRLIARLVTEDASDRR